MLDLPTLYTIIKIYIIYVLALHWKYSLKLVFTEKKRKEKKEKVFE